MNIQRYDNVAEFLQKSQSYLEKNEAVNNLILGNGIRVKNDPCKIEHFPYLATVNDGVDIELVGMMTPPFSILLYTDREKYDQALKLVAQNLIDEHWDVPGVSAPSELAEKFANVWSLLTGCKIRSGMNMRIYKLEKVNHPKSRSGKCRIANQHDLNTVADWMYRMNQEIESSHTMTTDEASQLAKSKIKNKELYIWEDGEPVSMAGKARPTANGVVVNLVYTPPNFRRKGYATSCVASLSQHLLDEGYTFCSLFTDLSNPTSNSIYMKIGYKPVSNYNEYRFENK